MPTGLVLEDGRWRARIELAQLLGPGVVTRSPVLRGRPRDGGRMPPASLARPEEAQGDLAVTLRAASPLWQLGEDLGHFIGRQQSTELVVRSALTTGAV